MDLTLNDAIRSGRLEEFVQQVEAQEMCTPKLSDFERVAERVIKAPPPKGQTSRLRGHGGSRGK